MNDKTRAVIADYELRKAVDFQAFTRYKPAGPIRWIIEVQPLLEPVSHCYNMTVYFRFSPGTSIRRIIYEGGRPEIPKEIGRCLWFSNLLQRCWHQDPEQRPTASQVVDTLTVRTPCRR